MNKGFKSFFRTAAVKGVLSHMRNNLPDPQKGKVFLPKSFLYLGLFGAAFFLIPTIITFFTVKTLLAPIIFSVLILLPLSLLIAYFNCKIFYDDECFVVKNFFGIKRKYTYDQVTSLRINKYEKFLYLGKRRVMIDEFSVGGSVFLDLVKRKYRAIHHERLPSNPKKRPTFNGNIQDSTGFIVIYSIFSVFALLFLFLSVYGVFFAPYTPENTTAKTVSFSSYNINAQEDTVDLISTDKQHYQIRYASRVLDTLNIHELCDGQTVVTAYCREITPDDAENYFSVKAISHGDTYLLSFDEKNRIYEEENLFAVIFVGILNVALFTWIAFGIYVGYHAPKFSEKTVRLFFKDGYIRNKH